MKPDLSEDQTADLLERVLGSPPVKLRRLREGRDSQAFGFRHGPDRLVLRVRTEGEGFRKDEMLQQRLAGPALPIPAVLAWGPAGSGHHFCIGERAAGITLEDADAITVAGTLDATLEALTAIHQTPIDWTNGFGVFDADGRAPFNTWPRALERWPAVQQRVTAVRVSGRRAAVSSSWERSEPAAAPQTDDQRPTPRQVRPPALGRSNRLARG
jgi:hygromycin-B 4-O-kinase